MGGFAFDFPSNQNGYRPNPSPFSTPRPEAAILGPRNRKVKWRSNHRFGVGKTKLSPVCSAEPKRPAERLAKTRCSRSA